MVKLAQCVSLAMMGNKTHNSILINISMSMPKLHSVALWPRAPRPMIGLVFCVLH